VRQTARLLLDEANLVILIMDSRKMRTGLHLSVIKHCNDRGIPLIPLINQMEGESETLYQVATAAHPWLQSAGANVSLTRSISLANMEGLIPLHQLIEEQLSPSRSPRRERRDQLLSLFSRSWGDNDQQQLEQDLAQLQRHADQLLSSIERIRATPFAMERHLIERNERLLSTLYPSTLLREHASTLAMACHSRFRHGFIGLATATDRERSRRLTLVRDELQLLLERDLLRPLRDLLIEGVATHYRLGRSGERAIRDLKIPLDPAAILLQTQNELQSERQDVAAALIELSREIVRRQLAEVLPILVAEAEHEAGGKLKKLDEELRLCQDRQMELHRSLSDIAAQQGLTHRVAILLDQIESLPLSPSLPLSSVVPPHPVPAPLSLRATEGRSKAIDRCFEGRLSLSLLLNRAAELISRTLPTATQQIDRLRQTVNDRAFKVIVAGPAEAGKSSLINAINRSPLLPTNARGIMAPLRLNYGGGAPFAHLLFLNPSELASRFRPLTQSHRAIPSSLTLETLTAWCQKVALEADETGGGICQMLQGLASSGASRLGTEISLPLSDFHQGVKEGWGPLLGNIQITASGELLRRGISFIELPSCQDRSPASLAAQLSAMIDADLIIFVTFAATPLPWAETSLLQLLGRAKTHTPIIFAINAIDQLPPSTATVASVERHFLTGLTSLGISDPEILPLSALLFEQVRTLQQGGNAPELIDSYRQKALVDRSSLIPDPGGNLVASGIPRLSEEILAHLAEGYCSHWVSATVTAATSHLQPLRTALGASLLNNREGGRPTETLGREAVDASLRLTVEQLRDELSSWVEESLQRLTAERKALFATLRQRILQECSRSTTNYQALADSDSSARQLVTFALQELFLISMLCQQQLIREAERLENQGGEGVASAKSAMCSMLFAHPSSLQGGSYLLALDFRQKIDIDPGTQANELLDELLAPAETDRQEHLSQDELKQELMALLMAAELDLAEQADLHLTDFSEQLVLLLQGDLENYLAWCRQLSTLDLTARGEMATEFDLIMTALAPPG
jgi:GTPase Era involved in 16S rRNA processing